MQNMPCNLPVDEKDNEQVVRVPKAFKVCTSPLFRKAYQTIMPNTRFMIQPSDTWTGGEVGGKERANSLGGVSCRGISHGELVKVDHVGRDMDDGEEHNRPGSCFMERVVLVEGDESLRAVLRNSEIKFRQTGSKMIIPRSTWRTRAAVRAIN